MKIALISSHSITAVFNSSYVFIFVEYVIESWLVILKSNNKKIINKNNNNNYYSIILLLLFLFLLFFINLFFYYAAASVTVRICIFVYYLLCGSCVLTIDLCFGIATYLSE